MLGAIIGDMIGSPYEFGSEKRKDFLLFAPNCRPTDDSIMTIAVGLACVESDCGNEAQFKRVLTQRMRQLGRLYPNAGFGDLFYQWLMDDDAGSYGSYSNGSAMRVSPTAWVAGRMRSGWRNGARRSPTIILRESEGPRLLPRQSIWPALGRIRRRSAGTSVKTTMIWTSPLTRSARHIARS